MAAKPALYGAWEVERFEVDGERPASAWRVLTVPVAPMAVVTRSAGAPLQYGLAHDEAANTLTLTSLEGPEPPIVLSVTRPVADELVLRGPLAGGQAQVHLRRYDSEHARLVTHGFHWVQEVPLMH